MDTKLNINAIEELSIPVTKLKDPENLTTGFANDLTGRNEATAEEFTFRPSAGNKSIRDDSATIKRIKGNSIVWNQRCDFTNGVFIFGGSSGIKDAEGYTITTNESNTTNTIFQFNLPIPFYSHKWLAIATIKSPIKVNIKGMPTQGFVPNTKCDIYSFFQSREDNWYWGLTIESVGTISEIKVYNYLLFDLTQMFGVGNEPDTVEEFRALFPGNHYEYNPGQLVSMTANGLFTNGFNQWDGKVEVGYISDVTGKVTNDQDSLCTDFIRVIPNQKYYINTEQEKGRWGAWYDANKNYVAGILGYDQVLTAPANAAYVRLTIKTADSGNPDTDTFCLNLSHTGVENGKYEPYWDATKDLSIIQKYFPNGMRSAGNIYDEISFDETTQKWVAIQRVGTVDLGSLSWFASTATPADNITNQFFYAQIDGLQLGYGTIMISAPYDEIDIHPNSIRSKDKTIYCSENYVGGTSPTAVIIRDSSYNDTASFKTAMSGVLLNYELAEPIITVIEEPINLSYKVGDFGIEQILSDSFSAPFRADIIYQFNATDRIRENSLNIEKLSKTQNEYLLLAGGTMAGQINSQDIKPVEDSAYQLGDSTHKYDNVFSNFFTGNLEGNAKTATDLTGRIEATPEVFTYRPSAGEKSIKDNNAFIRRVKGNSVVWNQQLKTLFSPNITADTVTTNGITFTRLSSGGYNISGSNNTSDIAMSNNTVANLELQAGHKYAIIPIGLKKSAISFYGPASSVSSFITADMRIITPTNSASVLLRSVVQAGVIDVNETIYCNVHDLTAMFGFGNEPETVEEFRELYPDSYYPYNAGELRNLDCSGIKTVGFNQWDEQWELGTLNGVGENDNTKTTIRSKNYTPAIGNADYYVGITSEGYDNIYYLGISWYDSNKNFISKSYCNRSVVTSPVNAAYFRIFTNTNSYVYGTTYNNDICVNLHHTGWRDGDYEPYKEVTHSLPLSQITKGEPLRKAGSVYDEINETHYIQRVGVVDLGSLNWSQNPDYGFYVTIKELPKIQNVTDNNINANILCTKYTTGRAGDIFTQAKTNSIAVSTTHLVVGDLTYNTANDFKTAMSGVMLNYELAEPIVTPIETPIDFSYYVEDFGTEEALLAEDSAPFSADIVYQFNATDTIRVLEKNIKQLLNKITSLENIIANAITNDNK